MAEAFSLHLLKIAMAQICQNLGWHAVQTSPMNILVDILHRYLFTFAQTTRHFCEHYNRTEPNLNDLGLAFKELGISLNELEEYVNNVEPVPFVHTVSPFPVPRSSQFHFPKEGCREVQHRPEWFHPHLPPAYPELEDDESVFSPSAISDNKACIDGLPSASTENGMSSPTSSPRPGMRRPLEVTQETNFSTPKRARLQSDEEGRPMREVISVTMTAAGIISPAREGRLPDARTPVKGFDDSRPTSPVAPEAPLSSPAPPSPPLPPPAPPLPPSEPPFEPEPPPPSLPPKEPVKKDENIAKISKIKNLQKIKEAKKVKIKKENKENKKKNLKDGKLKKKDILSKVGRSPGRPPKIKKDKVEKGVKISSVAKSPKSPKSPKVPKPKVTKLKTAKTEEKLKSPPSSAKVSATKSSPKPAKKHSAKPPRSPKGPKVKGKSPKLEKSVPGGQLASLLAKASGVASIKAEKMGFDSTKVVPGRDRDFIVPKLELPDTPSVCDSPERLVIDDNPESISLQERDSRMAAVDECISAVIQRGLHDEQHTQNSNSSSNAKSDSEGLSTVPAKVKLEPRDVYDFTDDEEAPGVNKRVEAPNSTPVPKMDLPPITKPKKEEIVVTKERHKEPRKSTRKEGERRGRKPKGWSPKAIKVEPKLNPDDIRPKTPEPVEDVSEMAHMPSSFHGGSAFGMPMLSSIDLPSSLSHIPPALLPFSIPSYLPPVCAPLGSGSISPGPSSVHGSYMPYPKLVDLADVAISKARNEGDFDIGKPKEKEQREKDKGKRKEKREKKEKDKLKLKKKKEKAKDKGAEKLSSVKEKEKQPKTKKEKLPSTKAKEKKDKVDKSRAKEKKKDKAKDKAKEKKEKLDKKKKEKGMKKEKPEKLPKEEVVTDADLANSSIPRLTFKLGSGMVSDGTKIVIKGLSNVDSPSASPLPVMNEPTPPISPLLPVMSQRVPQPTQSASLSSGKSHPKPQSKVQPVPPAPARTVITETVGTIIDEAGNKIWICPACTRPDDGSPMIGCDDCDEWYHWVCVGIVVPPKEDENWFCTRCIAKKQSMQKKRKHRKEK